MQHRKRALSLALALALVLSLALPAAAAGFSDLENHWAKSYMEDLADRGFLTGYTDGTMKPNNNITGCEALAFLSRFYTLTEAEQEMLYADWGAIAEKGVPATHKWAYDEVAVCLAAGIISETELGRLDLTQEIAKELLCVLLVRALGLEKQAAALSDAELSFTDLGQLTRAYRGYIAELVELGIIQGDEKNQLSPKLSVTRAVAATMVSRGIAYLEENGTELKLEDYSGLTRLEGILTGVTSKTVQLRSFDGRVREYTLSGSADITVNGAEKPLTYEYNGCAATLSFQDGAVTAIDVVSDSKVSYVLGYVNSTSTGSSSANTSDTVSVHRFDSDENERFAIPDDAVITVSGKTDYFKSLTRGQFIILKMQGKTVKEVYAAPGDYAVTGKLAAITYGTTIQLKVDDGAGTLYVFLIDATSLPTVKRGSGTITIDRLGIGDTVSVDVEAGSVKSISTEATEKGVTGKLISTTTTAEGTFWTLELDDGTRDTYQLDRLAGVYSGSKTLSLSDVQIGDTVAVVLYGSVISEIEVKSATVSSEKVTVTVLAVNSTEKTVTGLLNGEKLIYISTSGASLFSTATGKTVKLTDLKTNSVITAYGSYTSSSDFAATSIIVES